EAVELDGRFYVDASIVSNEPTRSLVEELRRPGLLHPDASVVHVYPVAPLPLSRTELADLDESREFNQVVEIASRALLLQRFRDATLDRRMTELYTSALPKGRAVQRLASNGSSKAFVRACVYPIEPDVPPQANERLLQAETNESRRQIILETVADGCRAALQAMLADTLDGARFAAGGQTVDRPRPGSTNGGAKAGPVGPLRS